MAVEINAKIDAWKKKLLDLGKRNRLINFKELKRATVKINTPDMFSMWNFFVVNENSIEFPMVKDSQLDDYDYSMEDIVTQLKPVDLDKSLRNLRLKAKTAIEEQGVNVLYLSFGMLKWKESSSSEIYFKSPIILVPVSLTVESIVSPYVLSLHEDEIVVNPTLKYKLENDFGITLPDYEDDVNIIAYLSGIREIIETQGWEVLDETWLSLLSFLKINMYTDLLKHGERVASNLNVRAIAGDSSASNQIPSSLVDFDYDSKTQPGDFFQVVDADSSQQDAILCAKNGLSFVLQGPPGTGKSQTITNIIAECLVNDKKVLFVSEKMAALDVVHRRLTASGLDDFCLVLHSHKANKKDVLAQLDHSLQLARNGAKMSDEAYQNLHRLQSDKEKLNEYVTQIHTVIKPLNKTIYEVHGMLANLELYDDVIFSIDNIEKISAEQFNRYQFLLESFVSTIGKMSGEYSNNPWYGANISTINNELRHDIGAKLGALQPKLLRYSDDINRIFNVLHINKESSHATLKNIVHVLDVAKVSPVIPTDWMTCTDLCLLDQEVEWCKTIYERIESLKKELEVQHSVISFVEYSSAISEMNETTKIDDAMNQLQNAINSNDVFVNLNNCNELDSIYNLYKLCKEKYVRFCDLKAKIEKEYDNEILSIDYKAMISRFKTQYCTIFKIFKKSYKEDMRYIRGMHKTVGIKLADAMVLSILGDIKELNEIDGWIQTACDSLVRVFPNFCADNNKFAQIDKQIDEYNSICCSKEILANMHNEAMLFEAKNDVLNSQFAFMYHGIGSDWCAIDNALSWTKDFISIVKEYSINNEFAIEVCKDKIFVQSCANYVDEVKNILDDIANEYEWYIGKFNSSTEIDNLNMSALIDRLESCKNNLFLLEEWIDFKMARQNCNDDGLGDYISKIEELDIESSKILSVFRKRFARLWLDAVSVNFPAVQNFRRKTHDDTIAEFAKLDRLQFEIAKGRIKSNLINSLPKTEAMSRGGDEISILRREISKQRKIMPIRKLFRAIPNLLLKLKPCLMMSPLSVSLFLEGDTYTFDTVIFDEASQVCTENAIGAISRGKQVIIAGDSKQLPPTNFFSASISDSDYDDDSDDEDYVYESILDEANLLPERTLLWHYRSRHEHLIAFSNAKIYKHRLITFPSNMDRVSNHGVEYVYVKDGYYDRGGKKGNVLEAQKVVELIFEHIKSNSNRSLGVIAFGSAQQQAIDTALLDARKRNQEYEHFFGEDKEEPFFIKSLENVQGDERDTIIFSIGYAKDIQGVFRMNFGPLGKAGGERRLNVAITRAKHNVKLVGSILPTDINIDAISMEGPKLLRSYIDFAMHGSSVLENIITENDIVEHDSPFEASVYNFLDRKGYKLATQVGCSGYKIDIVVKHPTLSGQYILGVECDGAAYHSARTARERDRLRQDVLENMGWKIYRIWSTDWIKDPVTEGTRLVNAIEDALAGYARDEEPKTTEKAQQHQNEFVIIEEENTAKVDELNPYGFEKQAPYTYNDLQRNARGYIEIDSILELIIRKRYPLHFNALCREMAPLLGSEKATTKVKQRVMAGLNMMRDRVVRKGQFYYPADYEKILVHIPNTRKIDEISTDEIAEAMFIIASQLVGVTEKTLCEETSRAFGFKRMTEKISSAMMGAFVLLLNQNKAVIIEGKVSLV